MLQITVLTIFDNNGQNSVTQYNANNFLQHCVMSQYGADICFANGKKIIVFYYYVVCTTKICFSSAVLLLIFQTGDFFSS